MEKLPREDSSMLDNRVKGGAFQGGDAGDEKDTPFGLGVGEGVDAGRDDKEWIVGKDQYNSDDIFATLNPVDGKINGGFL